MAVSFIGEGNRSTRRKPLTCRKSLTNVITGKRFHNYCTQQTACRICMQTATIVLIGFRRCFFFFKIQFITDSQKQTLKSSM